MRQGFNEWRARFNEWVQQEPVRAAESVRALLFALTALLAVTGVEVEATAVSGAITALFSIYASKVTRDNVSPVVSDGTTEDSDMTNDYIEDGDESDELGDTEIPV